MLVLTSTDFLDNSRRSSSICSSAYSFSNAVTFGTLEDGVFVAQRIAVNGDGVKEHQAGAEFARKPKRVIKTKAGAFRKIE